MASSSPSTASTRARRASGSVNVPMPQNRSATRLALPAAARTQPTMTVSASATACTKAPGGGTTLAPPMASAGRARSTMVSPSTQMRAMPWSAARRASSPATRAPRRRTAAVGGHVETDGREQHREPDLAAAQAGPQSRAARGAGATMAGMQDRTFLDGRTARGCGGGDSRGRCLPLSRLAVSTVRRRDAGRDPVQRPDLRVDAVLAQGLDDDAALPARHRAARSYAGRRSRRRSPK